MATSSKSLRTCKNGHRFSKSSNCPVCPVCEMKKKSTGFLPVLGAPARRSLENAGIISLKKLSSYSEKDILKLHGMGPASMPKLKNALKEQGLSFVKN
jgi:hypothetical protein